MKEYSVEFKSDAHENEIYSNIYILKEQQLILFLRKGKRK